MDTFIIISCLAKHNSQDMTITGMEHCSMDMQSGAECWRYVALVRIQEGTVVEEKSVETRLFENALCPFDTFLSCLGIYIEGGDPCS